MVNTVLVHCCLLTLLIFCICNAHIVKVENGFLRGDENVSKNGRVYYEFCGIPYAAPPVGNLRFKAPVSPSPWKGVRTSRRPPSCIQPKGTNQTKGQEDCLYLNVYTPYHFKAIFRRLPVMVFFHGGAYKFGDGISNDPKYFMGSHSPVIFVTLNHRLGVFGYLSMSNHAIPGNYGLKDQLMALKWINRNIKVFGGNPKSVTLMGQSTGALCVELHLLSEKSRGLFHNAIGQSGSILTTYGFYYPSAAKAVGTDLLLRTGCLQSDTNKTLACLQKLEADLLIQISNQMEPQKWKLELIFRPTIEYYGDHKDRFLSVDPRKSQYSSKVPYLHGHTVSDGLLFADAFLKNNFKFLNVLNQTYHQFLPSILDFNHMVDATKNYEKMATDIIKFYFGDDGISPNKITQLIQLFTDAAFAYHTAKSALTQNVLHYVYVFDHQSHQSLNTYQQIYLPEFEKDLGAGHSDDIVFMFYSEGVDKNMTDADKRITETLITHWTNFATHGNPNGMSKNITWEMVKSNDVEYLLINSKNKKMQKGLRNDRFNLWNSIFNN